MSIRPKHATSSVFLFCSTDQGWRLGLIRHPRFGRWMLPGGHVEPHENPAEAAVREVSEETRLPAYLLSLPGLGEPPGAAEPVMPAPVWVVEQVVPPEQREPSDHVHIDHLYLALTPRAEVPSGAELRFGWFAEHDLSNLHMFPDTLARAGHLFTRLADPTGPLAPARADAQSPLPKFTGPSVPGPCNTSFPGTGRFDLDNSARSAPGSLVRRRQRLRAFGQQPPEGILVQD